MDNNGNIIHEEECDNQPDGAPCICDEVLERKEQEYEDARLQEELEK